MPRTTGTIPTALAALALVVGGCADGALAPSAPLPRWLLTPLTLDEQVRLPGDEAEAPALRVADSSGAPARHVGVRFTVASGDGRVEVGEAATDDNGAVTSVRWSLGAALGLHRVHAEVVGEPAAAVDFDATVVPPGGPLQVDGRCPLPDSLLPGPWPLPRTAGRIIARQPLVVVAIGSSSTAGVGASVPDSSYPSLLAGHLRRLYPASAVVVHNAGRGGQTLEALQARFATDVRARDADLVVLQTGTVDAVNDVPVDAFEARLRVAVGALRQDGADVVLLDSQRYPGRGESAGYVAFQAAMRRVAADSALGLVRRYDWMSHWLRSGTYSYAQLLASDAFHTSDLTYSCTARGLAEGIALGVRQAAGR